MEDVIAIYIVMLAAFTGTRSWRRCLILHTPLMSGSNFVRGIVLVGAIVALGRADTTLERVIGFIERRASSRNAVSGYVVTERVLQMYKAATEKKEFRLMPGLLPENVTTLAIDLGYLLGRVPSPHRPEGHQLAGPQARRRIVIAGVGMLIGTLMSFLYPGMGIAR